MTDVLTRRARNRALLARQLLLERAPMGVLDAVEHLVGLQAQAPHPPYTGLWSRLRDFAFTDLSDLLADRAVVRIALMRSTIHLVTARDCLPLRSVLQPGLDRAFRGGHGRAFEGVDQDAIAEAGERLLAETPMTFAELGRALALRWPDLDQDRLAALVRTRVPLVQVTPRGLWGRSGQARHTPAATWLGQTPAPASTVEDLAVRYLAAFGPASPADAQTWSGLTGLREVFDRLDLRAFHDEDGRALYDLPDAPRPDPDTPAPVRLVAGFDNLILSHAVRDHVIPDRHRATVVMGTGNGIVRPTVLLDGTVEAMWSLDRGKRAATVTVEPFGTLTARARRAVETEAHALMAATDPGLAHEFRVTEP
ncbi:winged helix DNA-binding domain-containing protein [Actinokineospora auranticolor]|uniref:Winged helix DNA-binding protein n=1 Tax=Actinokineospora auranticolor TaxID=155976 RepID=A0A2S6GJB3_9PSEU|nr:winged helix DNA-binding domain-containing protein [Actinokineospora auranticolor]PPK65290.1 winged helix DNA-binding protein [Actinokineospora auranticolor]